MRAATIRISPEFGSARSYVPRDTAIRSAVVGVRVREFKYGLLETQSGDHASDDTRAAMIRLVGALRFDSRRIMMRIVEVRAQCFGVKCAFVQKRSGSILRTMIREQLGYESPLPPVQGRARLCFASGYDSNCSGLKFVFVEPRSGSIQRAPAHWQKRYELSPLPNWGARAATTHAGS